MTISNIALLIWLVFSPSLSGHINDSSVSPANHARIAATPAMAVDSPTQTPSSVSRAYTSCGGNRIDCPASISYTEFARVFTAHATLLTPADIRYAYNAGLKWGIDPAVLLAIWCKESTCASRGRVTHYCYNAGNVKWRLGELRCPYADGSYRSYPSWQEATDDWYSRIRWYYVDEGIVTLPALVKKYYRGDTATYIQQVTGWLAQWRREDGK